MVDNLPPNVESIPEGVDDCTLKDMIPIKNRFSNLHAYPGKTRNQKIVTINSKRYVIAKKSDGTQKRDKSAKQQAALDRTSKIVKEIEMIKEKMNDMENDMNVLKTEFLD